jgi:hypothetical protein
MQGCRRTARLGLRRFGLHLKNQGMAWAVVGRFLLANSAVVKCHIGRTATNYDLPNFMPIHSASSGMRPTLIASSATADASDNQMGRSQSMNRLQSDTHGFAKSYSHRVVRRELSDTCAFSTKSPPPLGGSRGCISSMRRSSAGTWDRWHAPSVLIFSR